jgi:hypothetical protein
MEKEARVEDVMHATTKSYLVNAPGQTKEVGMIEREETSKEQIARRTHEASAEGGSEHGNDVEDCSRVERVYEPLRNHPTAVDAVA